MRLIAALLLALGLALTSVPDARAVEEPDWTLVYRDGALEVRDYAPVVVAETDVSGERGAAINEGFRRLARYIFGGNAPNREIAMTAPVTRRANGRRIAMTAPVSQAPGTAGWTVTFVMPKGSRLEAMPAPLDPEVVLREQPARRIAALRFSGFATRSSLEKNATELRDRLAFRGETVVGAESYAFYNPPWTLPWLRRNEIVVEIRR